MSTARIRDLPAATAGNLDDTVIFETEDNDGLSVKTTWAQLKTLYNAVTSMTGDGTISVTAGVATLTIGALKIVTGMLNDLAVTTGKLAANAVTFAKMQTVAATSLLGNPTGSGAVPSEITLTSNLRFTGTTLDLSAAVLSSLSAPTTLGSDQTRSATTFGDVAGLALTVAANTKYWFEFIVIWQTNDAANGIAFTATIPASPTALVLRTEIQNALAQSTDAVTHEMGLTSASAGTGVATVDTSNANRFARVSGWLSNGANAGTIQLQMKCPGSAVPVLTVKAGSFGVLKVL